MSHPSRTLFVVAALLAGCSVAQQGSSSSGAAAPGATTGAAAPASSTATASATSTSTGTPAATAASSTGTSGSTGASAASSTGSSGSSATSSSGSSGTSSSDGTSGGSTGTSGTGPRAFVDPPAGELYHGVFAITELASQTQPQDVDAYEQAVGKQVAYVMIDDEWGRDRSFPLATAEWIRARGSVPHIRMHLRTDDTTFPEPTFKLDRIVAGDFDADLTAWGQAAAAFGSPLLVEYGTEVNGDWQSCNGSYYGGDANGPALFRAAFRHIVQVVRAAGATNTRWVFHVNFLDWPQASWNAFENYYPGDDVVDWVGVSLYASVALNDGNWFDFVSNMDATVARFDAMAPTKPQFVLEFGAPANDPLGDANGWADTALAALTSNRWPHLRGFSWWNERYPIDSNPADDTDFQVQHIPGMAAIFQSRLGGANVLPRPIFQ